LKRGLNPFSISATLFDPVTVIVEVAVLFPSVVVAVIIAEPTETAVTNPVVLTVATPVLFELHVIALLEAFGGDTFTVNC
jgi:hypothetical protein